jgi:D-ribose pyranose/furanose isomerase RbsD
LNEQVSEIIAGMGHGQSIVVVDAGYPIPADAVRIDLAVGADVPRFEDVLDAVLSELNVEAYVMADESKEQNQRIRTFLAERLPNATLTTQPHVEFRETARRDQRNSTTRAYIRTGDSSAYGSVMLVAGWVAP